MIARSPQSGQAAWQRVLADAIRDPATLRAELGIDDEGLTGAAAASAQFACRLPRPLLEQLAADTPDDPVLRQFLPTGEELVAQPGYTTDPVGDLVAARAAGLLQKYAGRALLVTTGACAVHCRYCFRRHFPYQEQQAGRDEWREAVATLAQSPDVAEVILSGGDPLMLSDERLDTLWRRLAAIPHLRRLRVHTRMPVVLPERVTDALTELLARPRFATSVVLHVNHANELGTAAVGAVQRLRRAGITLLNQSVLLRGVNDRLTALRALSEALFAAGVVPYYLHLLDPVAGAAHFAVSETTGATLVRSLREQLPGYLVPRLVRETPGRPAKEIIAC
jgi:EF-P beta-lysylation protein EpmB